MTRGWFYLICEGFKTRYLPHKSIYKLCIQTWVHNFSRTLEKEFCQVDYRNRCPNEPRELILKKRPGPTRPRVLMSQGVRVLVSERIHPLHNRGLSLTSYIPRSLFSPRALGMINWQSIGTRLMAAQLDVAGLLRPSERCVAEACVCLCIYSSNILKL